MFNTSQKTRTPMVLGQAALVLLLIGTTACGGSEPLLAPVESEAPAGSAQNEADNTPSPAPASSISTVAVSSAESELGTILIGEEGLTVYGFTNDIDGQSVCNGTCAEAWPPLIVGSDWDVAPGLDSGIFNTVQRDDGSLQLVAGKWPLYYFGGDLTAGDLTGQGVGEVWFVVGTDGVLIEDVAGGQAPPNADAETAAELVAVSETELGEILVDDAGLSLYGFLDDQDGLPTCFEACADAWPPVLTDSVELPAGLDADVFSVVPFGDSFQLKAGIWPLYRFAGDGAPGDINGQESGDKWFLARPDGGLIRPDAPSAPAADSGSDY